VNAGASPNPNAAELRIAGLTRLSTCDWPGELVATIFCQGCGWDCLYCHNPGLRPMESDSRITWSEVLAFLESRKGLLDGVVFTGGEATLQAALPAAVKVVREMGFRTGLHTAGMVPERLEKVLPWLDWVGFDVKAPFDLYSRITRVPESGLLARKSLEILLHSGVPCEVRTTVHPALLSREDLLRIKSELLQMGVREYAIQHFRREGTRSDELEGLSAVPWPLPEDFASGFVRFQVRQ
jgi:pyruvate formate lyase activating enzyme